MPDATTIAAIAAAAATLGGVAGAGIMKAVDAYLRVRKANFEEHEAEEGRMEKNYQTVIAELKGELTYLREAIVKIQAEHIECIRVQGELRGRLDSMEQMILRHDEANRRQVEMLKQKASESGINLTGT